MKDNSDYLSALEYFKSVIEQSLCPKDSDRQLVLYQEIQNFKKEDFKSGLIITINKTNNQNNQTNKNQLLNQLINNKEKSETFFISFFGIYDSFFKKTQKENLDILFFPCEIKKVNVNWNTVNQNNLNSNNKNNQEINNIESEKSENAENNLNSNLDTKQANQKQEKQYESYQFNFIDVPVLNEQAIFEISKNYNIDLQFKTIIEKYNNFYDLDHGGLYDVGQKGQKINEAQYKAMIDELFEELKNIIGHTNKSIRSSRRLAIYKSNMIAKTLADKYQQSISYYSNNQAILENNLKNTAFELKGTAFSYSILGMSSGSRCPIL